MLKKIALYSSLLIFSFTLNLNGLHASNCKLLAAGCFLQRTVCKCCQMRYLQSTDSRSRITKKARPDMMVGCFDECRAIDMKKEVQ